MNSSQSIDGKSKDFRGIDEVEHNHFATLRSAGEPLSRKNNQKAKDVKLSNDAKIAERGFKIPDRGDAAADKKSEENKAIDSAKHTIGNINMSPLKRAEANKIRRAESSNLQEEKYNKIMASINKIIQENIHLINTKALTSDDQSEIATEKVIDQTYGDKKDLRLQQPEKHKEANSKKENKTHNLNKNVTNTKVSNCTPMDLAKTAKDVKNTSLVIKMPKHTSGSRLQDKPKITELNKKSFLPKSISLQHRNVSPKENVVITRQPKIFNNKSNSYLTKKHAGMQTASKDQNRKPPTKMDSHTLEKDNANPNKPVSHSIKNVKNKNKKVKPLNKGSETRLEPMEDEHTRIYYEAWINTAPAKDQLIDTLPSEPVDRPETSLEDCTDKRFAGTIKVKFGKKFQYGHSDN